MGAELEIMSLLHRCSVRLFLHLLSRARAPFGYSKMVTLSISLKNDLPLEICYASARANYFHRRQPPQPGCAILIHLSSIRLRTYLQREKVDSSAALSHSLSHFGKGICMRHGFANLWKKSPMKPPLSSGSPSFPDLPNAADWPVVERHATVIRPNRPGDIRAIITHSGVHLRYPKSQLKMRAHISFLLGLWAAHILARCRTLFPLFPDRPSVAFFEIALRRTD